MTGRDRKQEQEILKRREQILELIRKGFTKETIAKKLELKERTVYRDWAAIREDLIAKFRDDAQGYASSTMEEADYEMEILTFQLEKARADKDDLRARKILELRHKLRMEIARLRQSYGWAPKVAEQVEQKIAMENPFEGLKVPEVLKKKKGEKDEPR